MSLISRHFQTTCTLSEIYLLKIIVKISVAFSRLWPPGIINLKALFFIQHDTFVLFNSKVMQSFFVFVFQCVVLDLASIRVFLYHCCARLNFF